MAGRWEEDREDREDRPLAGIRLPDGTVVHLEEIIPEEVLDRFRASLGAWGVTDDDDFIEGADAASSSLDSD